MMKPYIRALVASLCLMVMSVARAAPVNPVVSLETNKGNILIELDARNAPVSTDNFVSYVQKGFYDGLIFHRVIDGFMIQGGGFKEGMIDVKPDGPIKNEASNGLANRRGTIAMARTQDPDSATSQFFINLKDNQFLNYGAGNPGYAVFGKVVEGMPVVDEIAKVRTGRDGHHSDVPREAVIIKKAVLRKADTEQAAPSPAVKPAKK